MSRRKSPIPEPVKYLLLSLTDEEFAEIACRTLTQDEPGDPSLVCMRHSGIYMGLSGMLICTGCARASRMARELSAMGAAKGGRSRSAKKLDALTENRKLRWPRR